MIVKCIRNPGIAQSEGSEERFEVQDGLAGSLTIGKIYEVFEIDGADYRIMDNEGEDYLYPASFFEIVETTPLERHFLERDSQFNLSYTMFQSSPFSPPFPPPNSIYPSTAV